jgi:hypothetical protein
LTQRKERLASGLEILRQHRDGKGAWRRFPFYYTLLALSEMGVEDAQREIRYGAPRLEGMLRRQGRGDRFAARRRALAERLLASLQQPNRARGHHPS